MSNSQENVDISRLLTEKEIEEVVRAWELEDSVNILRLGRGHWEEIAPLIAKAQLAKTDKALTSNEVLSANKIELLWGRDHKRKLSNDLFRFVVECLHMQAAESGIAQDSDMFNAGYEKGRQSVNEWGNGDCPHRLLKVDKRKFISLDKRRECPVCWQQLLEETKK